MSNLRLTTRRRGWLFALCLVVLHTELPRFLRADPPGNFPVGGLIGDKYKQLQGKDGPLGKPTTEEMDSREGKGRFQTFEHGVIGWSPATGPKSVQVLYIKDHEMVFEWGDTAPFEYDFFLVRWDLNGQNLGQTEVEGSRTSGRWTSHVGSGGTYRLVVEGGDKELLGSKFPQGWSNALYIDYSPPPPEYSPYRPAVKLPQPPSRLVDPKLMPQGLYLKEWMRLGGPDGSMGLPTSQVQPHRDGGKGGIVPFENGQISFSPDVWANGILAAYQEDKGIRVDWIVSWGEPNPPSGYSYDRFILRWDRDGKNVGQVDINEDDTHLRTRGLYFLNPLEAGTYSITLEGAKVLDIGGVKAHQGWMHPVSVRVAYPRPPSDPLPNRYLAVNITDMAPAASVKDAQDNFDRRAAAVILHHACQPLPHTMYKNEENYGLIALAKLAYPDYYQSDRLPGRDYPVRDEVIESLRRQEVGSKTGTTTDLPKRTGEYDVALSMLIAMVYRYYQVLPPDVQNHVIEGLLNKRGPFDPDDTLPYKPLPIPETENHLMQIESARYLTNQLLFLRMNDATYDNASNWMDDWMLDQLAHFLKSDFIEYNARPYQNYTLNALLNLYSFTSDRKPSSARVKLAARMVLDYVMAKAAVSSNDSRRSAPYRRKAAYNTPHFINDHYDPMNAFSMGFAGTTDMVSEVGWLPSDFAGQMQRAGMSDYRVPDAILDLMIERAHRVFFQKFHHNANEAYAGSPSYLISAGGHYVDAAYGSFLGMGDDDIGNALPTTFMPTGQFLSRDDLIRFDGAKEKDKRWNMGVDPDFACGLNPVIPDIFHVVATGVDGKGRRTPGDLKTEPWTFIDQSGNQLGRYTKGLPRFGYYLAIYHRDGFGFLEAYDTTLHPGLKYEDFMAGVLKRNGATAFSKNSTNTYVMTDGRKINFQLSPLSIILHDPESPPFVSGTILNSELDSGYITIDNPALKKRIVLDMRDWQAPKREEK